MAQFVYPSHDLTGSVRMKGLSAQLELNSETLRSGRRGMRWVEGMWEVYLWRLIWEQ